MSAWPGLGPLGRLLVSARILPSTRMLRCLQRQYATPPLEDAFQCGSSTTSAHDAVADAVLYLQATRAGRVAQLGRWSRAEHVAADDWRVPAVVAMTRAGDGSQDCIGLRVAGHEGVLVGPPKLEMRAPLRLGGVGDGPQGKCKTYPGACAHRRSAAGRWPPPRAHRRVRYRGQYGPRLHFSPARALSSRPSWPSFLSSPLAKSCSMQCIHYWRSCSSAACLSSSTCSAVGCEGCQDSAWHPA